MGLGPGDLRNVCRFPTIRAYRVSMRIYIHSRVWGLGGLPYNKDYNILVSI